MPRLVEYRKKDLRDLNWTLPPLTAFLYAFGGYSIKAIRRFGVPAAVVIYALIYKPPSIKNMLLALIQFAILWACLTLPLTIVGDHMNPINMMWAFCVGALNVATLIPLCFMCEKPWIKFENLTLWIVASSVIYGAVIILSATFGWFEHKWTETIAGLLIGGAAADTLEE